MTKEILEELCSQHLLQIGELSCIVIRALNGEIALNTSPIGYWGKGSTVGWYFGIGQRVW